MYFFYNLLVIQHKIRNFAANSRWQDYTFTFHFVRHDASIAASTAQPLAIYKTAIQMRCVRK